MAWRQSSPITPPWTTATAREPPTLADARPRPRPARRATRSAKASIASPPGSASQRSSRQGPQGGRIGGAATRMRYVAGLPLAQVHLAEVGDDDRLQAQRGRERRRGLAGPRQRRHEQPVGRALGGQAGGHQGGLALALGRERRVPVAVQERERLVGHGRRGRAVTHAGRPPSRPRAPRSGAARSAPSRRASVPPPAPIRRRAPRCMARPRTGRSRRRRASGSPTSAGGRGRPARVLVRVLESRFGVFSAAAVRAGRAAVPVDDRRARPGQAPIGGMPNERLRLRRAARARGSACGCSPRWSAPRRRPGTA